VTSSSLLSNTSLVNFLSAAHTSVFSTAPFCLYVRMLYVSSSTLYSLLQTSVLGTMKPTYAWCLSHMLFVQWWLRLPALLSMAGQARPLYVLARIEVLRYPWGTALHMSMSNYTHSKFLITHSTSLFHRLTTKSVFIMILLL
jgi:hypothetical protein